MPADPRDTDPADRDPRDSGLQRRSGNASVSPWLIVSVIVLLAIGIYVVSALI